ncbi:DivIVA domain-containing protein [Paenibacillus shirakamiensis]|uniref:DivIVA domain-containing protein n=1 Tax=Paenibacillus shirakamiensis TaxID=1265935 RepID=A0ABS4JI16_9BACL|nr:DivIVA domain-containing protein [Paenibacillus shirakamiensis]MBP2000710.1 DivIVA domain-containing protein [Paenibacillus shirakamiensis]
MQEDYERKLQDQKDLFKQLGIKLDALSIHEKEFPIKMRGYEKEDVDRLLDEVIVDYERFYDIITDLLDKYKEIQRRQAYFEEEKRQWSAQRAKLENTNVVDRQVVDEGIRALERSLEHFRLNIRKEFEV